MRRTRLGRALAAAFLLVLVAQSFAPETRAAARAAAASNLLGEWAWTCCGGSYAGRFQITSVRPNGTFVGRFMETNATDIGTIAGTVAGSRVKFVRTVKANGATYTQTWSARLEYGDGQWHMADGFWNGYGDSASPSREFSADKVT